MKTVLYQEHVKLGAKIVDFSDWNMPIQYEGILAEHAAVRTNAGLFDVSHMGVILIQGQDAEVFLNFLSANDIKGKPRNTATYTVLCNEQGGSVDDTLIYKLDESHFFLVANAANRQKDLSHIQAHAANYRLTIEERYSDEGILSLQGPKSLSILQNLFSDLSLKHMHLQTTSFENVPIIISRTGYTGELGFEIFAPNTILSLLWTRLLSHGAVPCGLGARDLLRLEKAYALYGHELSDEISPIESVAAWVVKMENHDFLGKDALLKQMAKGHRHAYGLTVQEKAIPRENCTVLKNSKLIGKVTSGNFSPSLNEPIALFLTTEPIFPEDSLEVLIREKTYPAALASLPFLT